MNKYNQTETKVISAAKGVPLDRNAELTMFQYQGHLNKAKSLRMPPWSFVFNYFGMELPLTPTSTADGLIADVTKAYAEMAALYANSPAPAYTVNREQGTPPDKSLIEAAEDAVVHGQMLGNKYYNRALEELPTIRHTFSFEDITVPFNPWAKNEANRLVTAVRAEMA